MNRIAVDLGGTKIEAMITTQNPLEIIQRKRIPTEREKGYKHILKQVKSLIFEMKTYAADPKNITIGIGMPGSPHPETGIIRNSNTTVINGKKFNADIENEVNHHVHIANDANCFALSESIYGAAKNYRTVFGIIMGTGLGGGIIQDKKPVTGANGNGGEFGHTSIAPFSETCWCGRRGCIEQYLSGTGIQRMYKLYSGETATASKVYELYTSKDKAAVKTIDAFLNCFAVGFSNLYHLFHPDVFVIGGGVSNLPLVYNEGFERFLSIANIPKNSVRFLKNELGDSSGIFGAAMLSDL